MEVRASTIFWKAGPPTTISLPLTGDLTRVTIFFSLSCFPRMTPFFPCSPPCDGLRPADVGREGGPCQNMRRNGGKSLKCSGAAEEGGHVVGGVSESQGKLTIHGYAGSLVGSIRRGPP